MKGKEARGSRALGARLAPTLVVSLEKREREREERESEGRETEERVRVVDVERCSALALSLSS